MEAAQIEDLCKTIHGSNLDDKVKAILTKQLTTAVRRFDDANDEAKAAIFYMSQAKRNAARFGVAFLAGDDFEYAAQAARRAADKMKMAERLFRDASRMWDALTTE